MIENAGIMIIFNLPPYSYSFGLHPLHWSIGQMQIDSKCDTCHGLARANLLRIGPFTFVVTHQEHDHK